jgi:hypothetical protein
VAQKVVVGWRRYVVLEGVMRYRMMQGWVLLLEWRGRRALMW